MMVASRSLALGAAFSHTTYKKKKLIFQIIFLKPTAFVAGFW